MKTIPVLLFTSLLLGACDCGWNEECDDFSCDYDTVRLGSGDVLTLDPPLCRPWDHSDAVHTAESLDTTVVTATMSGREVTLTARDPGETHVYISSALMGNPNTGTFVYGVIVEPAG